jgi:hypothetical protein
MLLQTICKHGAAQLAHVTVAAASSLLVSTGAVAFASLQ